MRVTCSQCKGKFYNHDLYKILINDAGMHFFCSKTCRDEWDNRVARPRNPETFSNSLQEGPSSTIEHLRDN